MSIIVARFSKIALMVVAAVVISGPAFACADKNDKAKSKGSSDAKVTLCHATDSQANPYVAITVSTSAVDEKNNKYLNGHGDHAGGVWYQGIAAHSWGDIIPAFTSAKGTVYAGQSMNEAGKSILDNGCKVKATTTKDSEDNSKPVHTLTSSVKKDTTKVEEKNDGEIAEQLPETGMTGVMGLAGVIGASTYAVARRFMK